jgi:predicted RNA-binding protein with EMAP domain
MSPKILAEFKAQMRLFYIMYETLASYWDKNKSYPHIAVLTTLLQNLQFSGIKCEGYSHQKAVDDVEDIIKAIRAMKAYYKDDYMVDMVDTEIGFYTAYAAHTEFEEHYQEAE